FFKELYSNLHQNFTFYLPTFLKRKSGAKIIHIFETTKFFGNFFQKYLRTSITLTPFLKSGKAVQR
ncbi:MAG: hypothetical protein J6Q07_02880, partial [Alistipes sp.]|nr:hypothetical protein [Alistipes sp.]